MEIQIQLSELIRDSQLEWLRKVAENCLKIEREEVENDEISVKES